MIASWKCAFVGIVVAGLALAVSAKCECSDVRPRVAHDGPPLPFGCAEQRRFEKCNEPFMFTTIEELAAASNGLDDMVGLMEAIGMDPEEYQANPAWTSTVLVPQPGAFGYWLTAQGWSVESVLNDTRKLNILEDTIKLHILPPAQPLDALWTASFFTAGVQVPTMGFHSLSADKNEGFTSLVGPQNTVTLQDGEKEFCKGFMYVIDAVLLVAPMEIPPPPPPPPSLTPAEETDAQPADPNLKTDVQPADLNSKTDAQPADLNSKTDPQPADLNLQSENPSSLG